MKIDQMRDFITVAKWQNVTRSAAEMHTSQPSLSMRIAAIEREVGCPLFDRSNTGLSLTEPGRVFLDYAQKVVALYDEGLDACRRARHVAPVRVAVDPSGPLMRALPSQDELPFRVIELGIDEPAVDAVACGRADVALDSDYAQIDELRQELRDRGVSLFPAGQGACFLAMMADHPLAGRKSLRRADLDGQVFVVNSGAHLDRWSKVVRHIVGPEVRLTFRVNQAGSYANAALASLGDALYLCGSPSSRAMLERRRDVVVFDRLDGEPIEFPSALVCRTDDYADAQGPVGRFVRALRANLEADAGE